MGRLKIGITCYPTFGGSGVVATELGLALAARGHEIHFITSRLPARLQAHHAADVSFHEVNTYNYALFEHSPYNLALAAKMTEVTETFGLDLLHVHYAIPHAISAHLAQEMLGGAVKVVTTLHGTDITLVGADPSLHKITEFAINQADALTAVSHWLREETRREFNPQVPVQVVPNFIDTQHFRPDLERHWAGQHYLCGDHMHILHVSNFRPVKRAPEAIDVLAQVLRRHDAHLLMVGDGPDLQRVVQRAKELGVTQRVSYLGNREDVAYLMAAADVMLMPSESESFGLAALEAMACGCAVVSSNAGGLPELIRDGESGFLCEIGDTSAMAENVVRLIEDPEKLKQVQQAARQRCLDTFSVERVVPLYLEVYAGALGEPRELTHAG